METGQPLSADAYAAASGGDGVGQLEDVEQSMDMKDALGNGLADDQGPFSFLKVLNSVSDANTALAMALDRLKKHNGTAGSGSGGPALGAGSEGKRRMTNALKIALQRLDGGSSSGDPNGNRPADWGLMQKQLMPALENRHHNYDASRQFRTAKQLVRGARALLEAAYKGVR